MEAAEERWQIAAAAEAAATKCESTSKRELTLETGNMVLYGPDQVGKRAAAEKTATGLDLEESLKATNKQGHGDAMDSMIDEKEATGCFCTTPVANPPVIQTERKLSTHTQQSQWLE